MNSFQRTRKLAAASLLALITVTTVNVAASPADATVVSAKSDHWCC